MRRLITTAAILVAASQVHIDNVSLLPQDVARSRIRTTVRARAPSQATPSVRSSYRADEQRHAAATGRGAVSY